MYNNYTPSRRKSSEIINQKSIRKSSFKFNILAYDKNILLNSIKLSPLNKMSENRRLSNDQYIIEYENAIKEENVLITSFDLNENEGRLVNENINNNLKINFQDKLQKNKNENNKIKKQSHAEVVESRFDFKKNQYNIVNTHTLETNIENQENFDFLKKNLQKEIIKTDYLDKNIDILEIGLNLNCKKNSIFAKNNFEINNKTSSKKNDCVSFKVEDYKNYIDLKILDNPDAIKNSSGILYKNLYNNSDNFNLETKQTNKVKKSALNSRKSIISILSERVNEIKLENNDNVKNFSQDLNKNEKQESGEESKHDEVNFSEEDNSETLDDIKFNKQNLSDKNKLEEKNDILNKINFNQFKNFENINYLITEKTNELSYSDCKNSPIDSNPKSSPFSTIKSKTIKRLSDTLDVQEIWDVSCILSPTDNN